MLKDLHTDYGARIITTNWVVRLSRLRRYGLDRCHRLNDLIRGEPFTLESVTTDLETQQSVVLEVLTRNGASSTVRVSS